MVDEKQLASLILTVIVVGLVLSAFYGTAIDQTETVSIEEDVRLTDGDGELSWEGGVENFTIAQSLGDAVELTGANDSELAGSATVPHDETWSASLWVEADQVRTQRAAQLGGWLMVDLVNDSGTPAWRVTYYDDADWAVYQLSAPAENVTSWTHLAVTANESELTLAANDTVIASSSLANASGASVPQNVSNWDGRLEETRVYNDVISTQQRQTLYSEPTAPVRANETARVYYDAFADESTIDVYRTGADLELSNASIVAGFEGQDLDSAGVLGNGDYRRVGGEVIAVDGGRLDGAPVAFVGYDGTGGGVLNLARVAEIVNSSVQLLALAAVVGAAVILLRLWDDF